MHIFKNINILNVVFYQMQKEPHPDMYDNQYYIHAVAGPAV